MSSLAPGLYAIAWKRRTQTPVWRPELLEWDGSTWRYLDGLECTIARGPDWIGPKITLPGEDHATMENLRARFPWIADYDDGDPFPTEFRIISARIAALEATVARLTAPVTEDELRRLDEDWAGAKDDTIEAYRGALTAFLERRMKG